MKNKVIRLFIYLIVSAVFYAGFHFSHQITLYFGASIAYHSKDYLKASRLYGNITEFYDSSYLFSQSRYLYALYIYDTNSELALRTISELAKEDFHDSSDKYIEMAGNLGERLIEEGNYLKAIEVLEPIRSCCEIREIFSKAQYFQGMQLLTEGKEFAALKYFREASDYTEAISKKNELYLKIGKDFYDKGDYFSSVYYFEQLNESSDVSSYLNEAYYQTGKYLMSMKLYDEAERYFEKIQDYKDASKLTERIFEINLNDSYIDFVFNSNDYQYDCLCGPISISRNINYRASTFNIENLESRTYKLVLRTFEKVITEEIFELGVSDYFIEYDWKWQTVDESTPRGIYMYLLYRNIGKNWYIVDSVVFPVD